MSWGRKFNQDLVDDVEEWSTLPTGGLEKMIAFGVAVPAAILAYGIYAWVNQKALWYVEGGDSFLVYGDTAKSLAFAYGSIGLFCHFRWFWGLLPNYLIYKCGITLSLLGFIGGAFWAFVNIWR